MNRIENEGKFVADIASIGSTKWAEAFERRYGTVAYEEVRGFLGGKPKKNDTRLDNALRFALRSAAYAWIQDPH